MFEGILGYILTFAVYWVIHLMFRLNFSYVLMFGMMLGHRLMFRVSSGQSFDVSCESRLVFRCLE